MLRHTLYAVALSIATVTLFQLIRAGLGPGQAAVIVALLLVHCAVLFWIEGQQRIGVLFWLIALGIPGGLISVYGQQTLGTVATAALFLIAFLTRREELDWSRDIPNVPKPLQIIGALTVGLWPMYAVKDGLLGGNQGFLNMLFNCSLVFFIALLLTGLNEKRVSQ